MADHDDSNIRRFPGAEVPEQTLSVEPRPYGFCGHEKISLDGHNRTVKCVACGHVFDPFTFLQKEVHRLQDAWDRHRQVKALVAQATDRVEILKKEEARLKSRIKTARAKAEPSIDVRNRTL